jgi:CRISPR-associated protein Cst2
MNLFATVLTHPAPTANYRGESELNRTVIQKIADGRHEYPIVSPESMRNALREILAAQGLPSNRKRLQPVAGAGDEKQQLAVRYQDLPDPSRYVDDFIFGYLLAVKGDELKRIGKERGKDFPLKRDSVLRMNLAKGLEPYRHVTVFTQSPMFHKDNAWKVGGEGGTNSALLHRETADTAFQYPFALNGRDFAPQPEWCRALVRALGDLAGVSGNHARSLYFMSPASVVIRLTEKLAPGYEQYHFTVRRDPATNERLHGSKLVARLLAENCVLPRGEFLLGGEIVEGLSEADNRKLADAGVTLDADPARLLVTAADRMLAA